MAKINFSTMSDDELFDAALDLRLGFERAKAISELSARALTKPELLERACEAISSDRQIGFHRGPPLGWVGADEIYLSGNERALGVLLRRMEHWAASEQEDLVRHWAGKRGLETLTEELKKIYEWVPLYGSSRQ